MDIQLLQVCMSAASPVLSAVVGIPLLRKTLAELRHFDRGRRRTESDFAFKLAESTQDLMIKRYAEELGYAALVGDRHLTHAQRKILVSQENSERDIESYMRTRRLVDVVEDYPHFAWKNKRFAESRFRTAIRLGWAASYFAFCAVALIPWFVWGLALRAAWSPGMVSFQIYMGAVFFPLAGLSLVRGSLVSDAERFLRTVHERKARASPESLDMSEAERLLKD